MPTPSEKTVFEALDMFLDEHFAAEYQGTIIERAEDAAAFAIFDGISDGYEIGEVTTSEVAELVKN